MANAHYRRNHLARIRVDGVWLSEEQGIKEGVGKASKGLLITIKDSKPIPNALSSRSIDQEKDERPFTKEESLQFLSGLSGEKASGPGRSPTACWSFPWDFVMEDMLNFFRNIVSMGSLLNA